MRQERNRPVQAIENLKALGYKTAALALTDDSVSIDDLQLMSEEKTGSDSWNRGGRTYAGDNQSLRLYCEDSNVTWCGFSECGSSKCSGVRQLRK